jgi:dTDP-4-amino-4,6-dideoxygalactose transaminase
MAKIPFNKPYTAEASLRYIGQAAAASRLSGNGAFTAKCQEYLRARYGYGAAMLTASCTDALEMCAMLLDIAPGDEVIAPSYAFVSTARAFVRQGASVVFADSRPLGGIGHLGTFSFHETKNIQSGEGGALIVNDKKFARERLGICCSSYYIYSRGFQHGCKNKRARCGESR